MFVGSQNIPLQPLYANIKLPDPSGNRMVKGQLLPPIQREVCDGEEEACEDGPCGEGERKDGGEICKS